MKTNHGSVCLFFKAFYAVRRLHLPLYKSMELLAVHVHGASVNLLFIIVYQPGSFAVNSFFDAFADIIERTAVFAAPLVIVGNVNIHLDDISSPSTTSFNDILAGADLVQHVTSPTHRVCHTLDILITQSSITASVLVEPPSISDHSLITVGSLPSHVIPSADVTVIRQQWRHFDQVAFAKDLGESKLRTDPPAACDELFACYEHAPFKKSTHRTRSTAPWFNSVCRQAKVKSR